MTTTAYVIRFDRHNIGQESLEHILVSDDHFLDHVGFTIHELWKDPGPDAELEEVTHEE